MLPEPVYEDAGLRLFHGSNLEVLRSDVLGYPHEFGYHSDRLIPDGTYDSICTDPPYELGFMGKAWDSSGIAYDVDLWREAYRVLKPGGYLLSFGGTRTWHRIAAAIEDAGFEIRDSIAWMYGSGFPKSMNVSKAIDATLMHGGSNSRRIREANASRPGEGRIGAALPQNGILGAPAEARVTNDEPATDEGREWNGWGTALKPAFEPIIVARKPLGGSINVRARVESELRARGVEGEIQWNQSSAPSVVAKQRQDARSATPADASVTRRSASVNGKNSDAATASGARPTVSTSAPATGNATENSEPQSSTHTEANADAAGSSKMSSSRSTTSTVVEPPIDERSTARSTQSCDASAIPTDTESFAGTATGLSGSQAHVLIRRNPDGSFQWPDDLPEVVTVGPTVAANVLAYGTGAINIDACRVEFKSEADKASAVPQGRATAKVGALAGKAQEWVSATTSATEPSTTASMTDTRASSTITESAPSAAGTARTEFTPKQDDRGRFPSNVLLDESQAAELDRQAPNTGGAGKASGPTLTGKSTSVARGQFNGVDDSPFYGDRGGASRFFPTFRYEAKAPGSERPSVDGIAHATVKPLDLMRWLVRLVTRRGGHVLDLFAGSGTTGEAALLEGMECTLIEYEAVHLPLILARVRKPLQPSMFGDWEGGAA